VAFLCLFTCGAPPQQPFSESSLARLVLPVLERTCSAACVHCDDYVTSLAGLAGVADSDDGTSRSEGPLTSLATAAVCGRCAPSDYSTMRRIGDRFEKTRPSGRSRCYASGGRAERLTAGHICLVCPGSWE
jgi:hypothetical protein